MKRLLEICGAVLLSSWFFAAIAAPQSDALFSPVGPDSTTANKRLPLSVREGPHDHPGWASESSTDTADAPGGKVLRSRLATIDLKRLEDVRFAIERGLLSEARLDLNLFGDADFKADSLRVAPTFSGYSLSGRLDGVPYGTMTLVVNDDVLAGSVRTTKETFTIRSVKSNLVAIQQVIPPPLKCDAHTSRASDAKSSFKSDRQRSRPLSSPAASEDETTIIDVLVVYTPAAADEFGGKASTETMIDLWVAETNQAYTESGVDQQIHLVHTEEVTAEEEDNTLILLNQLENPNDGHMDHIHEVRDRVGADLVHIIAGGRCSGRASLPGSVNDFYPFFGFGVTKASCSATVFAHELGHNMGLAHDRYAERAVGWPPKPYPYGHGYVNQAAFEPEAPSSAAWHTIMAYVDQCYAESLAACTRILRFSNPDQEHLGDRLGVPGNTESFSVVGPADARRSLNNTRTLVADYREPQPVLTIGASVSEVELAEEQSFTLRAEIRNRGRPSSTATSVTFHRSSSAWVTAADEVLETLSVEDIAASGSRTLSIGLTAPAQGGDYYYGACLNLDQAPDYCSTVHVTVGPTASVADASAVEGRSVSFPVSLSAPRSTDVALGWIVSRGTALPGVDIAVVKSGSLTIPAGETSGTITIETVADDVAEPEDRFTVALTDVSPPAPEGIALSVVAKEATGTIVDDDGDFTIADPNLRLALEVAIHKADGEEITADDMALLTELNWSYQRRSLELGYEFHSTKIASLRGLEFATNLRTLNLGSNDVQDIAPLAHLPKLESLSLSHNGVADAEPLKSQIELRELNLNGNKITDINPLQSLTKLRGLYLSDTAIQDPSALAGLTKLEELVMRRNSIEDLSPLARMTRLKRLWVSDNSITDLQPLAALGQLEWLELDNNPVSDLSPLTDLTKMIWLELDGTQVSDLGPIHELTNIRLLSIARAAVSDLAPIRNFTVCGNLNLDNNAIADLSTLEHLTNLTVLSLTNNKVSDVKPLAGLTKLRHLHLGNNLIRDITPLAGLTSLIGLALADNLIADIEALAELPELAILDVAGNMIVDVAPLSRIPRLSFLNLADNRIADISLLASGEGFGSLDELYLHDNPLGEESREIHLPTIREMGVRVYHISLSVLDASAKEGEELVLTVRMSSAFPEPVAVQWGLVGSSQTLDLVLLNMMPTVDRDDLGQDLGTLTIPANATESMVHSAIPLDDLDEPHEYILLRLSEPDGGFPPGIALHRYDHRFVNGRTAEAIGLIVDASGPSHDVSLFPPARHEARQGFARLLNRGKRNAVHVEAFDDLGRRYGPTTLSAQPGETVHFNSQDLEVGNFDKGLARGVGPADGTWRLKLWSNELDMFSYMRTSDGFLTSMHDTLPQTSAGDYYAPIFNPGSNRNQVSLLRLTNPSADPAEVSITGTDDMGESPGGAVTLTLDAGAARTITARELESGDGLNGALGDGAGKWRLTITADRPLVVASLMESPTGHLTNLSTLPDNKTVGDGGVTTHHVPLFLSAADPKRRQGFVRVVNRGTDDATVSIEAFDDTEWNYDTVTLNVGAGEAAHFNSEDLELGNASKGLSRGIGAGEGDWRLELTSEADINVLAYIRTEDGFLTSMHDTAPQTDDGYAVPIFNPGSNRNQVSHLYIANAGEQDAAVTIEGVDDLGVTPGDAVAITVPAGRSRSVSAQMLETGGDTLESNLGDGTGKWRLTVASDQPVQVLSLLESPTGHLTNLSTATGSH